MCCRIPGPVCQGCGGDTQRQCRSLDAIGQVVLRLALRWVPEDEPLFFPLDDTLAHKGGKCIALASIHHDPLLSTRKKPFFRFGHCWVALSLWVQLPTFGTGFALPLLFRLYAGRRPGGERDAPSHKKGRTRLRRARRAFKKAQCRTKLELGREMVGILASWAPERRIYLVCDSAYAGRTMLEGRPDNVHFRLGGVCSPLVPGGHVP